jgi:nucleotide-binding universal stress UspA family protein
MDLSADERPPRALLDLLSPARVVLVGWYPVPDQTPAEALRAEHEAEAVERVESVAAGFPDDGAAVETLVVFTRDRATTVDRVADEYDCEAVLVPRAVEAVSDVLVPIRSDVNLDAILPFVGALLADGDATATLLHVDDDGDDGDDGVADALLRGAADRLVDAGLDPERARTRAVAAGGGPVDAILDAAATHDVVVLGESEPSLVEGIVGDVPSRVIDRTDRPVLVVRDVD